MCGFFNSIDLYQQSFKLTSGITWHVSGDFKLNAEPVLISTLHRTFGKTANKWTSLQAECRISRYARVTCLSVTVSLFWSFTGCVKNKTPCNRPPVTSCIHGYTIQAQRSHTFTETFRIAALLVGCRSHDNMLWCMWKPCSTQACPVWWSRRTRHWLWSQRGVASRLMSA